MFCFEILFHKQPWYSPPPNGGSKGNPPVMPGTCKSRPLHGPEYDPFIVEKCTETPASVAYWGTRSIDKCFSLENFFNSPTVSIYILSLKYILILFPPFPHVVFKKAGNYLLYIITIKLVLAILSFIRIIFFKNYKIFFLFPK